MEVTLFLDKLDKYSVTYGELCFGIENGDSSMKEVRWGQLDLFTQRLLIDPWDEEAARHYGFN